MKKRDFNFTILQLYYFTILQLYYFTILQLYYFTISYFSTPKGLVVLLVGIGQQLTVATAVAKGCKVVVAAVA